ncbi:MAG: isoprenylcysteine carboxylmethyltransferase family protein [Alphaproteobacteria bacterium]|nr:isoprenylcysteine carboxylmethyltransferase family protein [Alphaproteobacteria bacterium]
MAKDSPGVIAPPPLLALATIALGLALDAIWPAPLFGPTAQAVVGGALLLAGLGLVAACALRFRRAGTNVPTYRPTTALVTDGPYRFSRNPIYIALLVTLAGLGIAVDSAWLLAGLVPLFVVLRWGVVAREERYLEAKFPDAYPAYMERVRRWL